MDDQKILGDPIHYPPVGDDRWADKISFHTSGTTGTAKAYVFAASAIVGTVRNVTDFGAFVDIGVHRDGLVHISQMAQRRVNHPSEVVRVGDIVTVWVLEADAKTNRISLTMRPPAKG